MTDPRLPLFVYGTLAPGQLGSWRLEPVAEIEASVMPGLTFDTAGIARLGRPTDTIGGHLVWFAEEPGHSYSRRLVDLDTAQGANPDLTLDGLLRLPRPAILTRTGETVHAWVYLTPDTARASLSQLPRLPRRIAE